MRRTSCAFTLARARRFSYPISLGSRLTHVGVCDLTRSIDARDEERLAGRDVQDAPILSSEGEVGYGILRNGDESSSVPVGAMT
jgi:hypothetical protein